MVYPRAAAVQIYVNTYTLIHAFEYTTNTMKKSQFECITSMAFVECGVKNMYVCVCSTHVFRSTKTYKMAESSLPQSYSFDV